MKKTYFYNLVLTAFLAVAAIACSEEEVAPFSGTPGINFTSQTYRLGQSSTQYEDPDDPDQMGYTSNFLGHYERGRYGDRYDTIHVQAKLEGMLPEQPLRVNINYEAVEGVATPNLTIARDSVIKPGEYLVRIQVIVERPAILDSTYQAKFVFDYANSDVVAGSEERQSVILEVSDTYEINENNMYASDEADWNSAYSSLLGNYGPERARFILSVFGSQTATLYMYTRYYDYAPQLGFASRIDQLRDAVAEYNATHDTPLQEADGTLITF